MPLIDLASDLTTPDYTHVKICKIEFELPRGDQDPPKPAKVTVYLVPCYWDGSKWAEAPQRHIGCVEVTDPGLITSLATTQLDGSLVSEVQYAILNWIVDNNILTDLDYSFLGSSVVSNGGS